MFKFSKDEYDKKSIKNDKQELINISDKKDPDTDAARKLASRKYYEKASKSLYENLYLYTQIVIASIFIVASIMLKLDGGFSYTKVKGGYYEFFKSENVIESNFSYESFVKKMKENIAQQYNSLVEVVNYTFGKGANDIYPSNVSLKKYTLPKKGIRPVDGYISSPFGIRKNPFNSNADEFHTGMDIATAKGTFIKASFDGEIIQTGYSNIAGNYIRISTDQSLQTFYGHNQFIFVKEGEKVLQGQVIASIGDSGMATGPHVHFEVIHNGYKVNPIYAIE